MTLHLIFEVLTKDLKEAKFFLEERALHPLYHLQEKKKHFIGGFFTEIPTPLPPFIKNYSILDTEINWTTQWQEFSPNFKDHLFELDLSPYGITRILKLKPGPGFGDLSHPTTKLCLKHMSHLCCGHTVIDFGCGSGILSVAAWAFGAYKVISLEIDQPSIEHAKQNLAFNGFPSSLVLESMPPILDEHDTICVINMTFGEQKIALKDLSIFKRPMQFLSSGILSSQKEKYLSWAKMHDIHFELLDELEGWCLFKGLL